MKAMLVEFQKTGERRYAVIIKRDGMPDLKMNPAPGFDALMPHDLLHYLVEEELGLRRGIFGQVALGGTAGTFQNQPSEDSNSRADSRLRRKTAKRGKRILKEKPDDCAQSERATFICLYDWLFHSADEELRLRAQAMKITFESILGQIPENERKMLDKEKLAAIRNRMDELSKKWSALRVDQSLTLEWSLK
jgi:hypothetical protein